MKHISILIPNGNYSVVNIMGSFQILSTANEIYRSQHGKDLFQIDLLGFNVKALTGINMDSKLRDRCII